MAYEINYYQAGIYDSTEIVSSKEEAEQELAREGFKLLQNDGSWYDKERCMWAYIEPLIW